MFGRRRRSTRWAERPSVLSTWDQSMEGAGGGTFEDMNSLLTAGGVTAVFTDPMIVPRACRITRYAIRITNGGATTNMTVTHQVSSSCLFDVITASDLTTHDVASETSSCFCRTLSPSLQLDECWLWRVLINFSPVITNPRVRIVTHLELR